MKQLPQEVQLACIFSQRYNKKKRRNRERNVFLVIRTLRISSSHFPICHTAVSAVITRLYKTSYKVRTHLPCNWKCEPYDRIPLVPPPSPSTPWVLTNLI